MSRNITSTLLSAMEDNDSFEFLLKAEVYPSRIFFPSITSNFPITGADAAGIVENPLKQEIALSPVTEQLVTFFSDNTIKYAKQGSSSVVDTFYPSTVKPAVFGNKLYIYWTTNTVSRLSIDWNDIDTNTFGPFDGDANVVLSHTPAALHAISEDEFVAICENDGGFTPIYVDDETEFISPSRFMFPKTADWDGSDRSMQSLGIFSGAARLGNRIFIYISAAHSGMVSGIYYDLDTGVWSNVFTALPTDRSVSLCEFWVSNAFSVNNKIYLVGQFNRTDFYGDTLPYTMVLDSFDGMTFSMGKHNTVANNGYRALANVFDGNLYVAGSNRICFSPATHLYLGTDDSAAPKTLLPASEIITMNDSGGASVQITLRGGAEVYVDHAHVKEGARLKLFTGYRTTEGEEYVLYSTYVIDGVDVDRANGSRSTSIICTHEGQWKGNGLSMPFYAEISGLSGQHDHMNKEAGKMYAGGLPGIVETKFWTDMYLHDAYSDLGSLNWEKIIYSPFASTSGAVRFTAGVLNSSLAYIIITSGELKTILNSKKNPKITGASLTVKAYGWSRPQTTGSNSVVNVVIVTCDENGEDEQTTITSTSNQWPKTYPDTAAGNGNPITFTISGMTVGRYIKKVGFRFSQANHTITCPARLEFVNNVEVNFNTVSDLSWSYDEGQRAYKLAHTGQGCILFAQKPYNAFNFSLQARFRNELVNGYWAADISYSKDFAIGCGLVGLAEDESNYICARYNVATEKVQLVKVRDAKETILAQSTVVPDFTVHNTPLDPIIVRFDHRDGHFDVYLFNPNDDEMQLMISYDWKDSDGFLFTSATAAMKCGVYGIVDGPRMRILPFYYFQYESGITVGVINQAIGADPLATSTELSDINLDPGGYVQINGKPVAAGSMITMPSVVRGPYPFVASDYYEKFFDIEVIGFTAEDFEWTASNTLLESKAVVIESSGAFILSNSLFGTPDASDWQPDVFYHNFQMSQHFIQIHQQVGGSKGDKVWFTGGFGISPGVGGESEGASVATGDYAHVLVRGDIYCESFMGTGGDTAENTVSDLIQKVCALTGTQTKFPGDLVTASMAVNGTETIFEDLFAEGLDVRLEMDAPESFDLSVNIKIKPDNQDEKELIEDDTDIVVRIDSVSGGDFELSVLSMPSETVMYNTAYEVGSSRQTFRFFFFENKITVFHSGRWAGTAVFDELIYDQTDRLTVDLITTASVTFENLILKDLSDYREAVYIDLETDAQSAISSVIQERPVEIVPQPDGSLAFLYNNLDFVLDTVEIGRPPLSHRITSKNPPNAASDAIVYGSHEVKTLQYQFTIENIGFSTKLFRFPNLNIGMIEAAKRTLHKIYESRNKHTISVRPRVDVVVGDIISFAYDVVELGKTIERDVLVESVTLGVSNSDKINASMTIEGRDYLSENG